MHDPEPDTDTIVVRRRRPADEDRPVPWQPDRTGWVVIALGVGVRLAWATVGARMPRILADPALYHQAALRIASGQGYRSFNGEPTSYYPPGYPWFLGSLQWLLERVGLGESTIGAVAVLQSLLSGVAIAAVMVAGRALAGRRAGIAAGVTLALWPNVVFHASLMLSETLFVTLLSLALAAMLTMVHADRLLPCRAVVAGTAIGCAMLVRPQVLVVVVAAVLGWALSGLGLRDVLRRSSVLVVGVVVIVSPWTIRNAVVLDAFVPVSTNDGDNLCVGFHAGATGHFDIPEACDTGEFYIDGPEAELRRQSETRQRAIDYIVENPSELPGLSWKKLYWTYRSDDDAVVASQSFGHDRWLEGAPRRVVSTVGTIGYLVAMAATVAGAGILLTRRWRSRPRDPAVRIVMWGTLFSSLVPVLFFGDSRFKVASVPFYVLLAGVALAAPFGSLHAADSDKESSA
jgi:4-amino-4-deoxy-L-arabinose transferase-like glycosyltransferase